MYASLLFSSGVTVYLTPSRLSNLRTADSTLLPPANFCFGVGHKRGVYHPVRCLSNPETVVCTSVSLTHRNGQIVYFITLARHHQQAHRLTALPPPISCFGAGHKRGVYHPVRCLSNPETAVCTSVFSHPSERPNRLLHHAGTSSPTGSSTDCVALANLMLRRRAQARSLSPRPLPVKSGNRCLRFGFSHPSERPNRLLHHAGTPSPTGSSTDCVAPPISCFGVGHKRGVYHPVHCLSNPQRRNFNYSPLHLTAAKRSPC